MSTKSVGDGDTDDMSDCKDNRAAVAVEGQSDVDESTRTDRSITQ